jgi:hypothetical protein
MRFVPRLALIGFVVAALCAPNLAVSAPRDPLRFIPDKADLVLKVENPRQFIEGIAKLDAVKDIQQLDPVRQALDSVQVRRFFQLVKYYERDLTHPWPQLIDKLAGGGIALGVKYENGPNSPVLLAMQGTDAAVMHKFLDSATKVLEQEFNRQESKTKLAKLQYKQFETWTYGDGLHLALVDDVLLVSNKDKALHAGLDLASAEARDAGKSAANMLNVKSLADAKKLLPPDPLLWLSLNLEYVKQQSDAKNVLTTPRNDSLLTFAFAGWLDAARRSPYLALGLYKTREGYTASLRMPAGREGRAADVVLHLPDDDSASYSLPLLEPKGVVFSHSFYLDLGAMWEKRDKIFNEKNAKEFEKGVKEGSRFLPGAPIDKLFTQSGVYHRFMVVQPGKLPYGKEPGVRVPAFAFVTSMRDPQFAKSMEILIKGVSVLAGFQVKLKPFEEMVGDVKLYGYRFAEDAPLPVDEQNIRFNFVPCFAQVKDQYIFCTNPDLLKELVGLVQKEDRKKLTKNMQMRLYATGIGALINASPEQLLTQTILTQAIPEAEAKKQVESLLKYLENLGTLQLETDWQANEFRFNFIWKAK